jgi:thiamine biosynthesis protein ThiS
MEISSMEIQVNGQPHRIPGGTTLTMLLASLGREPRLVAVEHNGTIVPRARFGELTLRAGDRIEIVQFVQGG